jgi:hypothetical protein
MGAVLAATLASPMVLVVSRAEALSCLGDAPSCRVTSASCWRDKEIFRSWAQVGGSLYPQAG